LLAWLGNFAGMTNQPAESPSETPDESVGADRVHERALELTPEELVVGSDDPERQAQIILEDSDERTGP
jgi:hypothetical protein